MFWTVYDTSNGMVHFYSSQIRPPSYIHFGWADTETGKYSHEHKINCEYLLMQSQPTCFLQSISYNVLLDSPTVLSERKACRTKNVLVRDMRWPACDRNSHRLKQNWPFFPISTIYSYVIFNLTLLTLNVILFACFVYHFTENSKTHCQLKLINGTLNRDQGTACGCCTLTNRSESPRAKHIECAQANRQIAAIAHSHLTWMHPRGC